MHVNYFILIPFPFPFSLKRRRPPKSQSSVSLSHLNPNPHRLKTRCWKKTPFPYLPIPKDQRWWSVVVKCMSLSERMDWIESKLHMQKNDGPHIANSLKRFAYTHNTHVVGFFALQPGWLCLLGLEDLREPWCPLIIGLMGAGEQAKGREGVMGRKNCTASRLMRSII